MGMTSSWMLKALVQNVFSVLPNGHRLYTMLLEYALRLYPNYYDRLHMRPDEFEQKLQVGQKHIENYLAARAKYESADPAALKKNTIEGRRVLELGTGWYPVVPIALYLSGVSQVWTVDIVSHLRLDRINYIAGLFLKYAKEGKLSRMLTFVDQSRLGAIEELTNVQNGNGGDLLKELGIFRLIADARRLKLRAETIDLFVSNNVLEHIPKRTLEGIFGKFRRLAASKAVMSHFVDLGDHHSYVDETITRYNYRKYNKYVWRLFNNSINHQNRLCVSDYKEIHDKTGWAIVHEEIGKGNDDELAKKVRVSKEFHRYQRWEWFVDWYWLTALRDAEAGQGDGQEPPSHG